MVLNPFAYFDCLCVGVRLHRFLGNFSIPEIHLFSYLACLLSLYKGRPVSEWNYDFSITLNGYPYSADLDSSIKNLIDSGYFKAQNRYIEIAAAGEKVYYDLMNLTLNSNREPFIDGACASVLSLPIGVIRSAISQESEIDTAIALSQSRKLLTDAGLTILYDQFKALSSVISLDIEDLMVPSVVWLSCLSEIQNS